MKSAMVCVNEKDTFICIRYLMFGLIDKYGEKKVSVLMRVKA